MLAGKSGELIALAALRDRDAILVEPLLDLVVAPGVEELVGERRGGGLGGRGSRVVLLLSLLGGDIGVAAERRDELVAVAGLRDGDTALVEPRLQVGVGPLRVEPVTRVGSGLAGLVRRRLVVAAGGVEERIAGAGRRVRDAVVIEERLELGLSPAVPCQSGANSALVTQLDLRVKDPLLGVAVSLVGLVGSLVPDALHLREQAILVLLGTLLDLLALAAEVALQLVCIPLVVRLGDVVLPVLLHEVLQVLAVGWSRVGDIVVRQPALELSLMPLVVCYAGSGKLGSVRDQT